MLQRVTEIRNQECKNGVPPNGFPGNATIGTANGAPECTPGKYNRVCRPTPCGCVSPWWEIGSDRRGTGDVIGRGHSTKKARDIAVVTGNDGDLSAM